MRELSFEELHDTFGGGNEPELRHDTITVTGRQPPAYPPNGGHFLPGPTAGDPCILLYQSVTDLEDACNITH